MEVAGGGAARREGGGWRRIWGGDLEGGGEEATGGRFPRLRGSPAVGRDGSGAGGDGRRGQAEERQDGRCRGEEGRQKLGKLLRWSFSACSVKKSFWSFRGLENLTPFGGAFGFWSFLEKQMLQEAPQTGP